MANCGYYGYMYKYTTGPNGTGSTKGYSPRKIDYFEDAPITFDSEPWLEGSRVMLVLSGPDAHYGSVKTKNVHGGAGDACAVDEDSESASASSSLSPSGSFNEGSDSGSYSHSGSEVPFCSAVGNVITVTSPTSLKFQVVNNGDTEININGFGFDRGTFETPTFSPNPPFGLNAGDHVDVTMTTDNFNDDGEIFVDIGCAGGNFQIYIYT